ncbi:MAG: thioredoxin [Pseudomonadota bacterium]
MTTIIGSDAAGAPAADLIKDATTESFAEDVLAASKTQPVLVDFWAPWCGPCKQLTPVLEKVVSEAKGSVRLVKVNIDENQLIAREMRIQSIPAVIAFVDGRPVDGFMGAVPESDIKALIDRLGGGGGAEDLNAFLDAADEAFNAGDLSAAAGAYGQAAQADPQNVSAIAGLARCHIANNSADKAREMLKLIPPDQQSDPAVASVMAALELAEQAEDAGDVAALKAAAAAAPEDCQARFDLANALLAAGAREEAVEELLSIIKIDRAWNDEEARKKLLTLFEAFGPKDPLTLSARRKLSSILFS